MPLPKKLHFHDRGSPVYLDGAQTQYEIHLSRGAGVSEAYVHSKDLALLFTAAPDLLVALKEALDLLKHCGPEANEFGMVDRVRAAIAKAEGDTR